MIPGSAFIATSGRQGEAAVFVVENGKAARRKVPIGRERTEWLEIADGLKPGDVVIAEQSIEIADGVRVQAERRHVSQ